jgi:hypothetical protein
LGGTTKILFEFEHAVNKPNFALNLYPAGAEGSIKNLGTQTEGI